MKDRSYISFWIMNVNMVLSVLQVKMTKHTAANYCLCVLLLFNIIRYVGSQCQRECTSCYDTYCYACTSGYYVSQYQCLRCQANYCKSCRQQYTCDVCMESYYLDSGYCYLCKENCISCTNQNNCHTCNDGYTLLNNQCYNCNVQHCAQCSADYTCAVCNQGYFLDNNEDCRQCSIGCDRCSSWNFCTTCSSGYGMFSGKCYLCPTVCSSCTGDNQCDSCTDGYYLNQDNCYKCPDNCLSCLSSTQCTSCKHEYYGVNGCSKRCTAQCKDSDCAIDGRCVECIHGWYEDNCYTRCKQDCYKCQRDSGDCLTCNEGTYLSNGNCNQCQTQCKTCNNAISCSSCREGTYLSSGDCLQCPATCTACTSSTRCSKCVAGYWGDKCEKTCTNCKAGTTCWKYSGKCVAGCIDGKTGDQCLAQCRPKCLTCQQSADYKCTACVADKYGYYGGYGYFNCTRQCSTNCINSTCNDKSGDCTYGCIEGYVGSKCASRCYTNCNCDNYGNCLDCKDGFGNTAMNCECTKQDCQGDDCSTCTSSSYFQYNGYCCSCSLKDKNCAECSTRDNEGFGECTSCETGYYPSSQTYKCEPCPEKCKYNKCDPATGECTDGCYKGLWGGTKCDKACPQFCQECDQFNGTCIACNVGRYTSNCTKTCPPSCKEQTCRLQDGSCIMGCNSATVYGSHCQHQCSSNCTDLHCDWQTSHCTAGCIDNHYGDICDGVCSPHCLPVTNGVQSCYETNGTCIMGCQDGYHGALCEKTCTPNCVNVTCEQFTGACIYGCTGGFLGSDCTLAEPQTSGDVVPYVGGGIGAAIFLFLILVIVFIVIRKRRGRKADTSSSSQPSEPDDQEAAAYDSIPHNDDDNSTPLYASPHKKNKETKTLSHDVAIRYSPGQENVLNDATNPAAVYENVSLIDQGATKAGKATRPVIAIKPNVKPPRKSGTNIDREDNKALGQQSNGQEPVNALSTPSDKAIGPMTKTPLEENVQSRPATNRKSLKPERSSVEILEEEPVEDAFRGQVPKDHETYYNVAEVLKRKIALDKLQQTVASKTAEDFIQEFEMLPPGLIKPYKISRQGGNASKNRYQGIYPYDETLVILKGENAGYMNASYINGYRQPHAYIASMGPTIKYMKDISPFWKMIWQENVGKIVMLTKLWEAGTNKCDQYWPDKDLSLTYGDIVVTCQSELVRAEYVVRSFQVTRKNEKRILQQLHYTAWPDKGTPDDVTSLVIFRQRVNSLRSDQSGPLLVHCSAGIGRTGTYIALDMLTLEGEAEGSVDVLACVRNMREQRVNMVQTWPQYQYLHYAIVHTLTFDSKPIEATRFQDYMSSHSNKILGQKFLELQATMEKRSEEETSAINSNKQLSDRNRAGADVPGNLDRPRLYLGRTAGTPDYINARFINSYKFEKHYIVAQTPLPNTVNDFLTLAVQEQCSLIINMDDPTHSDQTIGSYLPFKEGTLKSGPFKVTVTSTKQHDQDAQRNISVEYGHGTKTERLEVTHVQYTKWPHKNDVPQSLGQFLHFIKDMETSTNNQGKNGPVLVHCITGAERSGLFCVVSVILEMIECDQEVSVVNAVRQIKSKRHMAIPNQAQYIFCHECINEYLESFDVYTNFATKA